MNKKTGIVTKRFKFLKRETITFGWFLIALENGISELE